MSKSNTQFIAAWLSLVAIIGLILFCGIVTTTRLASEPWYRSPLFTVVGSFLAAIALLAGALSFMRGIAGVDSRHRHFAAVGIVVGMCYLVFMGLKIITA